MLNYDMATGVFTWRVARGCRKAGETTGCVSGHGHMVIGVDGVNYLAHRLAWLWVTGQWPTDEVDHVNHVKADNRWVNLREATREENARNVFLRADNTSGFKGVTKTKAGKYRAQITLNGKVTHLGTFNTSFEAKVAYDAKAKERHGEYATAFAPMVPSWGTQTEFLFEEDTK